MEWDFSTGSLRGSITQHWEAVVLMLSYSIPRELLDLVCRLLLAFRLQSVGSKIMEGGKRKENTNIYLLYILELCYLYIQNLLWHTTGMYTSF